MTFVGPNQATEWGCDSMWEMNGTPNLENCVAVFGMMYDIGPSTPHWLQTTVNTAAAGRLRFVDDTAPFPGTLDLNAVLPQTKSHFTYPGSLVRCPHAHLGLRLCNSARTHAVSGQKANGRLPSHVITRTQHAAPMRTRVAGAHGALAQNKLPQRSMYPGPAPRTAAPSLRSA